MLSGLLFGVVVVVVVVDCGIGALLLVIGGVAWCWLAGGGQLLVDIAPVRWLLL